MSIVQPQPQPSEATKKVGSDGEEYSDTTIESPNFELDTIKTATSSSHHDSEYDTASDSQTSDDEVLRETDDVHDGEDDGSIELDLERQRGDGEENDEDGKKVDDDEDRSNPQYIPKKGVFYEHDDRTADEPVKNDSEDEEATEEKPETPVQKKGVKKTTDRWCHDFFDASQQAPKSRAELVDSYGYDIRSEDGPPKARRIRRYNRGPGKYTRSWEDENAYGKQQRNPRPDDFPALGTKSSSRRIRNKIGGGDHDKEEVQINRQQTMSNEDRRYSSNRSPQQRSYNDRERGDRGTNSDRRNDREKDRENDSFGRGVDRDRRFNRPGSFKSGREFTNQKYKTSNENNSDKRNHNSNTSRNYSGSDHKGPGHSYRSASPEKQQQQQKQHLQQHNNSNFNDNEHVGSISFTNSKLSSVPSSNSGGNNLNNNNRYVNGSEYAHPQRNNKEPEFVECSGDNQQQQLQQQSQIQRNERPITGRQQHPGSIPPLNAQPQQMIHQPHLPHHPSIGAIPPPIQQLNKEILAASTGNGHHESNRPKRYSSLRQRGGEHAPNLPLAERGMPMQLQDPNLLLQMPPHVQPDETLQPQNSQPSYTHKNAPASNYPMANIEYNQQLQAAPSQQPPPAVVQNIQPVVTPNQYQPNYYNPNEYPQPIPSPQMNPVVGGPQPQYAQPAPYLPTPQTNPAFMQQPPPQTQPGASVTVVPPQMEIMSFVPTHTNLPPPTVVAPSVVPSFSTYPPVQNYNSAQGGITYYAPQSQPPLRPILPQRRPTNAIPIMAPPDRLNNRGHRISSPNIGSQQTGVSGGDEYDDDPNKAVHPTENIDHILDNMFVQRAPYQPTTALSATRKNDEKPSTQAPVDVASVPATTVATSSAIETAAPPEMFVHAESSVTAEPTATAEHPATIDAIASAESTVPTETDEFTPRTERTEVMESLAEIITTVATQSASPKIRNRSPTTDDQITLPPSNAVQVVEDAVSKLSMNDEKRLDADAVDANAVGVAATTTKETEASDATDSNGTVTQPDAAIEPTIIEQST